MPLLGHGVLAIWHTITPEGELEYWRWHDREHIPERVGVPGFLRGRRYRSLERSLDYLDLYEVEDSETLRSAPYLARLNDPTPWTRRMVPHFLNTLRVGYRVAASAGRGQGGVLLTMQMEAMDGAARPAALSAAGIAALQDVAGVVSVHVLDATPEVTSIATAEKRLRGPGDRAEARPLVPSRRGGRPGGAHRAPGRAARAGGSPRAGRRAAHGRRVSAPDQHRPRARRSQMALIGQGVLIIWHAMTPEGDLEMIRWHDREHVAERVGIPGFRRGRRYDTPAGTREYLDIYETDSAETVRSAPYILRLNFPTEWTKRVLPHFRNTVRLGCETVLTTGRGQGGALLTLRARPAPGRADVVERWLRETLPAALLDETGVVGVHVLHTVPATTQVKTNEGKLKGGEVGQGEEPWPWVLLVETGGLEFAEGVAGRHFKPADLAAHGVAADAVLGRHRLQLSMDEA